MADSDSIDSIDSIDSKEKQDVKNFFADSTYYERFQVSKEVKRML